MYNTRIDVLDSDVLDSDSHRRSCPAILGGVGRFREISGNGRLASTRKIKVASWNIGSLNGKLFELADCWIITDGPYVPTAAGGLRKPKAQWSDNEGKGLVVEAYEWDEEDVASDDNEMIKVKVLMALADDESGVELTNSLKNPPVQKDLVFVKSSSEDNNVSKLNVERPWLYEAEGFSLPNYKTSRILTSDLQVNITEHSITDSHVNIIDSSITDYDSDEEYNSVCNTPLPPLKKLPSDEPQTRPKTIKSILKSCSTKKVKTSKGVTINETNTSSAPAKGNKNVALTSKKHSAPASKLKDVKTEDDIPMSINHEKYTLTIVDEYVRGISHNFSSPYTQEQNGVAKRRNRTLIEAARTMLVGSFTFIIKDHLGKFDAKADDGYFLGYSLIYKAFRVFNTTRQQTEETFHITFDESTEAIRFLIPSTEDIIINDEISNDDQPEQINHTNYEHPQTEEVQPIKLISFLVEDSSSVQIPQHIPEPSSIPNVPSTSNPTLATLTPQDKWSRDKHIELVNIVGNPGAGMLTRKMDKELIIASAGECHFEDFLSEVEPKKVSEALKHPGWDDAM
ncbi:retrovirus-related pol polyprotein from transposon TNT 1-94 [Tanacetum coccineum]